MAELSGRANDNYKDFKAQIRSDFSKVTLYETRRYLIVREVLIFIDEGHLQQVQGNYQPTWTVANQVNQPLVLESHTSRIVPHSGTLTLSSSSSFLS